MKKVELKMEATDIKDTRDMMYNKIVSNKSFIQHLEELGVTFEMLQNNIGLIYDYFESLLSIADCKNAGFCINDEKHHALSLVVNPPFLSLERHLCPVYIESQQIKTRFIFRDFPISYLDLKIADVPRRKSFANFMRELRNMADGECYLIYAYGSTGIGKLETAVPFVTRMLEDDKSKTAGVVDFPNFVRESITDYFENKENVDSYLQHYIDLDVLVLDGFGNEEVNQVVIESIIFPIVATRVRQKKPTIILAGLSTNDLRSLYVGRSVRGHQIVDLIKANIKEEIYLQGTKL